MKTDLNTLQDLFKISYEAFEDSRIEEREVTDLYHNRHYTVDEIATLQRRGQPPETFNIVKLFSRLLVGYYSTVVNTVKIEPRQESDTLTAMLLQDTFQYTIEDNSFETESEKIKLDALLSGLMVCYITVEDTNEEDEFGRPLRRIDLTHVPSREILLDPMSVKEDYSDARWQHRFKWVSEDTLREMMMATGKSKAKADEMIRKLNEYENHVNQEDTEFTRFFKERFMGIHKEYSNFLLVHSIVIDDKGDSWSIFWVGDDEISRKKVTYREVRFPYRIQRIFSSDITEYYGLFRDVRHSQKAVNQAILKIQLMANSQKAFVQQGAVKDINQFTDSFNRVNAVIEVLSLDGIKIENLTQQVLEQYALIDKAFDRIQKILGVNDSFLGHAFASDSGRKVKLQQNTTIMSLRYVTVKIEQFYRLLGWDVCNLIKQFYTAHQVIRIADEPTGYRWMQLNQPIQLPTGQVDPETGQPAMYTPFEEVTDPESGEPMVDEDGNYIMAPIPTRETEIAFTNVDISIDTVAYNDEDEKNQLMLETIIQGPAGQFLLQANPAAYARVIALSMKTVRTKHSHEISEIFDQVGQMLSPEQQQMLSQGGGGGESKMSQQLKLPTNTNEALDE